jgi:glycosyltransferase involved in cell wall biosynthesis
MGALNCGIRLKDAELGEVVWFHSSSGYALVRDLLFTWLVALRRGKRVVLFSVHSEIKKVGRGFLAARLVRLAMRTSPATFVFLCEKQASGVFTDGTKYIVLRNAAFGPEAELPPPEFSRPSGPVRICFLGSISAEKGFGDLLLALSLVPTKSFELVVAGGFADGRFEREVMDYVSAHPEMAVSFLGTVSGKQKQELLASCHVMVLPSRTEGFPVSLIEGSAHGLAVVATPVGCIGEIARGAFGLAQSSDVISLRDEVTRLIMSPDYLMEQRIKARALFDAAFRPERYLRDVDIELSRLCGTQG